MTVVVAVVVGGQYRYIRSGIAGSGETRPKMVSSRCNLPMQAYYWRLYFLRRFGFQTPCRCGPPAGMITRRMVLSDGVNRPRMCEDLRGPLREMKSADFTLRLSDTMHTCKHEDGFVVTKAAMVCKISVSWEDWLQ